MVDDHVFTVSEFNEQINLLFGQHFPEVVVEGEISEIHTAKSNRLLYVTLKDKNAELTVFAYTAEVFGWRVLEAGMSVQVFGRPEIYAPRGQFNLHAHDILPVGEGALRIAFEKLKERLSGEGLFAPERKRPLPFFPEIIGLITAPGRDAYSDFIKVLGERMGGIKIIFFPVQVQGIEAPRQIIKALNWFAGKGPRLDLLVIARGGGSLEDLAAFNTEEVVRAVFSFPDPVVSAVGHEADISLVDLVADLRASTPSNAAELIVRHRDDLNLEVDYLGRRIYDQIELQKTKILGRVSQAVEVVEKYFYHQQFRVAALEAKAGAIRAILAGSVADYSSQTNLFWQQIDQRLRNRLDGLSSETDSRWRLLKSLNPKTILARGYSITQTKDGRLLKDTTRVKIGDLLETVLSRGKMESIVNRKS